MRSTNCVTIFRLRAIQDLLVKVFNLNLLPVSSILEEFCEEVFGEPNRGSGTIYIRGTLYLNTSGSMVCADGYHGS